MSEGYTYHMLDEDDPRHGTYNGYLNYRCRCDFCREASRLVHQVARKRRGVKLASSEVAHGIVSTYTNWGCRCDECRAAKKVENRKSYLRAKARRAAE